MTTSGIATIKLTTTNIIAKVKRGVIKHGTEQSTAELTIISTKSNPFTLDPPFQHATITMNDGVLLFNGWIYNHTITPIAKANKTDMTYILFLQDLRGLWANEYDTYDFTGRTQKSAIVELIGNLTDHEIGTNDLTDEPIGFKYEDEPRSSIIKQIVGASQEAVFLWSVEYDTVTLKFTHHFKRGWETSVGTVQGSDNAISMKTTGFYPDTSQVRNKIKIVKENMEYKDRHQQFFFFEDNEPSLTKFQNNNCEPIYFEQQPVGELQVSLIAGAYEDTASFYKCPRYLMKIVPTDEQAKLIMAFAMDQAYSDSFYNMPEQLLANGIVRTSKYYDANATGNLTTSVRKVISGMFEPDLNIYFQAGPDKKNELGKYGVLYMPIRNFIKQYITNFNKVNGCQIKPDEIIGYEILYRIKGRFSRVFEDVTSSAYWGPRTAGQVNVDMDIDTAVLYGMAKLEALKSPTENGTMSYCQWSSGNQLIDFYPMPGDLVNLHDSPAGPDKDDIKVGEVTYSFEYGRMMVDVSGNTIGDAEIMGQIIKSLELKQNMLGSTTQQVETQLEFEPIIWEIACDVLIEEMTKPPYLANGKPLVIQYAR